MQGTIGNDNNQNQTHSNSTGNVVNVNVGFPHIQTPNQTGSDKINSPSSESSQNISQLPNFPEEVKKTIKINRFLPKRMSRRAFIQTATGTTVGLTGGWFAGQHWPRVTWKMVSFVGDNPNKLILWQAPEIIRKRIDQMTGGNFTIELVNTGDTEEILKDVSDGNRECGYSGVYYNRESFRVLFFGCAIPFGLNPQEQNAWLHYKDNPDDELTFMQKIYPKLGLNVIPFPAGATGAQMGGWFNKEINSIADFNGITMRIPGLGGDVLRKLGVKTEKDLPFKKIPIDQIADKVRDTTLDAAEWVGPYDDFQLGLHNVLKYYYYPGWWEPGTTYDIQVNTYAWKDLPKKYQEIFRAVCLETHIKILAEYDQKNSDKLQVLKSLGIIPKPFDQKILIRAKKETDDLLKYYAKKDKLFNEVYSEWSKFRDRIKEWSKLNREYL
ncbi:TRAP transporter substrate-binding protein [Halotia branconii]|uniref:ABC transporter substrate-binding protein n=1 Tax=Halotia branconii CENA392 TaxID=1539056 RepID=A0AAJ6P7I4_9CYAN|nr:ABC transporter substrate-binding protein [Halotia branconii]WGV23774.1 ABC transporter substrate-binding protein [Halotia branconii CENA392]